MNNMSDFIPPLIPSSPPPMPDFDEDEDDEFGMNYGIGDLDLPGAVIEIDEKRNKIVDSSRLEINGGITTPSWKCEEQDSTSQDSGLCMASHGSEGMSPLPQSDEDEKQVDASSNMNGTTLNLKHSSTVVFNTDEAVKINGTLDSISQKENAVRNDVLLNDTGQFVGSSVSLDVSDCDVKNNEDTDNKNENCDFDDEFVWGCAIAKGENRVFNCGDGDNTKNSDVDFNVSKQESEEDRNSDTNETLPCGDSSDVKLYLNNNISFDNNEDSVDIIKDTSQFPADVLQVNGFDCENDFPDTFESNESVLDTDSTDRFNCFSDSKQTSVESVKENEPDQYDFDNDDDEFGNFASVTIPSNCDPMSNSSKCYNSINSVSNSEVSSNDVPPPTNESDATVKLDEDCSFPNIVVEESSVVSHLETNKLSSFSKNEVEDSNESVVTMDDCEEDDFDDFSDFTQSTVLVTSPPQQAPEPFIHDHSPSSGASQLNDFQVMFPLPEETSQSVNSVTQQLEYGPVWKHLCPLENSPALTFQWSNSKAHNKLLSSLSIDSRNILFGPNWNTNMPRFAANLGSNPLQPVKAAEGSINSLPLPNSSDDVTVVPDAHFDWGSSGLTNPLDSGTHSALLDLEIISTFDNLTTTNNCVPSKSPSDDIELLSKSLNSTTLNSMTPLSVEAESIILSLPDLHFMRKTYIEFLINKD